MQSGGHKPRLPVSPFQAFVHGRREPVYNPQLPEADEAAQGCDPSQHERRQPRLQAMHILELSMRAELALL